LLDRINEEKVNGKKKTVESEEKDIDIDKVW
jgi:hypothetical protein